MSVIFKFQEKTHFALERAETGNLMGQSEIIRKKKKIRITAKNFKLLKVGSQQRTKFVVLLDFVLK